MEKKDLAAVENNLVRGWEIIEFEKWVNSPNPSASLQRIAKKVLKYAKLGLEAEYSEITRKIKNV